MPRGFDRKRIIGHALPYDIHRAIIKQAKEKGHEFRKREIHTAIESAKPIPVGRFIPKEFSMAYME